MRWITRQNIKVDRVACPWLIKRFIDPRAEFLFVPEEELLERARQEKAIPFDATRFSEVRLNHRGERCTFDAILEDYNLTDPALHRLGLIVRGADVKGQEKTSPESPGLRAIAQGFTLCAGSDEVRLATSADGFRHACKVGIQPPKSMEVFPMIRWITRKIVLLCACLCLFSLAAAAQDVPSEYQDVLKLLDRKGDFKAGVLKVNVPRSDLKMTIQCVSTPTAFGFGGGFSGAARGAHARCRFKDSSTVHARTGRRREARRADGGL